MNPQKYQSEKGDARMNAALYGSGFLMFYYDKGEMKAKSIHPMEVFITSDPLKNQVVVKKTLWQRVKDFFE